MCNPALLYLLISLTSTFYPPTRYSCLSLPFLMSGVAEFLPHPPGNPLVSMTHLHLFVAARRVHETKSSRSPWANSRNETRQNTCKIAPHSTIGPPAVCLGFYPTFQESHRRGGCLIPSRDPDVVDLLVLCHLWPANSLRAMRSLLEFAVISVPFLLDTFANGSFDEFGIGVPSFPVRHPFAIACDTQDSGCRGYLGGGRLDRIADEDRVRRLVLPYVPFATFFIVTPVVQDVVHDRRRVISTPAGLLVADSDLSPWLRVLTAAQSVCGFGPVSVQLHSPPTGVLAPLNIAIGRAITVAEPVIVKGGRDRLIVPAVQVVV